MQFLTIRLPLIKQNRTLPSDEIWASLELPGGGPPLDLKEIVLSRQNQLKAKLTEAEKMFAKFIHLDIETIIKSTDSLYRKATTIETQESSVPRTKQQPCSKKEVNANYHAITFRMKSKLCKIPPVALE